MKLKNFLLLVFIYCITICFVIYLCVIYKNSSRNVNNSVIYDYVIDVTGKSYDDLYNNISNYNGEVNDYVVYVVSYRNSSISSFENMFRNVIVSNGLNGRILYINVDNLKRFDYINSLVNDFSFNKSLSISDLPIFICFHDGRIADVVSIYDYTSDSLYGFLEDVYD